MPATLSKKRLRCFPVDFAKFIRTPFLTEHLQWLRTPPVAAPKIYAVKETILTKPKKS